MYEEMYEEAIARRLAKETGMKAEYISGILLKWLPPITAHSSVHLDAYKKTSAKALKYGLELDDHMADGNYAEANTAFAHEALFRKIASIALREVEIATYRERKQ